MSISRVFLGWDEPCLRAAARWLVREYCQQTQAANIVNLQQVVVAMPVSRALRRLTELLVEEAQSHRAVLVPSTRMCTLGELPELLYQPDLKPASPVAELIAWRIALQATPAEELSLLSKNLPGREDHQALFGLAEMLSRLWHTIAAAGIRFEEVAPKASSLASFEEEERWQVLSDIFSRYEATLASAELSDTQLNRIRAVGERTLAFAGEIILIAAADMPLLLRQMLRGLEVPVTSLVFAPSSYAEAFDDCGALRQEKWLPEQVPLADKNIYLADDAESQAFRALEAVVSFSGKFAAEEITVSAGDPLLVPYLEEAFAESGAACRSATGRGLRSSEPLMLLSAISAFCASRRFEDFTALLRHPAFEQKLLVNIAPQPSLLSLVDRYQRVHLQGRALSSPPLDRHSHDAIARLIEETEHLLAPLLKLSLKLGELREAVSAIVGTFYGGRELRADRPSERAILESCTALRDELQIFAELPPLFNLTLPPTDGLSLLLRRFSDRVLTPDAGNAAIEIVGWLELQLDDAPGAVMTGMHEGCVPQAINVDPFLPDSLRRVLGLLDNEGRFARDLFVLKSICVTKEEWRIVVGRRSTKGEQVLPGRVLFACSPEEIRARIERLYMDEEPEVARPPRSGAPALARSAFEIPPRPLPLPKPITSLPVTAFGDYLDCKYRFYLRHVLKLGRESDAAREMEPDIFGTLVHVVLKSFADSDHALSKDATRIESFLHAELGCRAEKIFGTHPLPAVVVQLKQLEGRLSAFALKQAEHRLQGWEIAESEIEFPVEAAQLVVDGVPMTVRARVDRIDVKREGKSVCYALLDYKTGEYGDTPEKVHGGGKHEWRDLQLPLYAELFGKWKGAEAASELQLGYVVLPRMAFETRFAFAKWSSDDLTQAVQKAHEVVRNIRREIFWPPRESFEAFDPYGVVVGANQFLAQSADEEGE